MSIGKQLRDNLKNSSNREKKQMEFEGNLRRFQESEHAERDYMRTQKAMEDLLNGVDSTVRKDSEEEI